MKFDYKVKLHKSKQRAAQQWCVDTFGSRWNPVDNRQGLWTCVWAGSKHGYDYYMFHFNREEDFTLFMLRWL